MLTKAHIKNHMGQPLCKVRTTRSIGVILVSFSEWRELRQTAQCGKCFHAAKKAGWFKTAWIDPQTGEAEKDPLADLHDPHGFAHDAERAVAVAHAEDNAICDEPQTESIEEAADNLIGAAKRSLKYLRYARAIHAHEREECIEQLSAAIEDLEEWLNETAEMNQTPAQMGWVGRNGQP